MRPQSRRRRRRARSGRGALGIALVAACLALLAAPALGRLVGSATAEAAAPAASATTLMARDIRVIDGDTIEALTSGERVRLINIDAAETGEGARCAAEARHAQAAKAELALMVRRAVRITILRDGVDAYGRTLATVSIDGRDAGTALIEANFARPWEGRRRSWCGAGGQLLR